MKMIKGLPYSQENKLTHFWVIVLIVIALIIVGTVFCCSGDKYFIVIGIICFISGICICVMDFLYKSKKKTRTWK